MKVFFVAFLGVFISVGHCSLWSPWGPCTTSCGAGIKRRLRNCTSPRATAEYRNCSKHNMETNTCDNRPCSDFAIKCFHCRGSESDCRPYKLRQNVTYDACNKYHDRCITTWDELEPGVTEVKKGCGSESVCKLATDTCKRKTYQSRLKCDVRCCQDNYCNNSCMLRLGKAMMTLYCVLILNEIHRW